MKRIRYIFPPTDDFRETRPVICWEHMYGWLDGYGALFDPVVLGGTRCIPDWENGVESDAATGDFVITPCAQASALFTGAPGPGLYVRPGWAAAGERGLLSEKEALATPVGEFYYPFKLLFDRYADGDGAWLLGERPGLAVRDGVGCLAFEFFAMIWAWSGDWHEERLLYGAELLRAALAATGAAAPLPATPRSAAQEELRLDFQAAGITRLQLQWFLAKRGADPAAATAADGDILAALAAWEADDKAGAKAALGRVFQAYADLRAAHSNLELCFMEYPHAGLMLPDKGFFEFEWPALSRRTLLAYCRQIEDHGYRVSIEAGANCWTSIARRYPDLVARLRDQWDAGNIELTNGTWSLPYALVSPLALQYWQFRVGRDAFVELFGRAPQTYQAQENSLSPQMPELLRHFGYERALHISQNRGSAPPEDTDFIRWTTPAGHGIESLALRERRLGRMGVNYFLDLPLIHDQYADEPHPMPYVNFQDLGFVPLRIQLIRALQYAPVWGRYMLANEVFGPRADEVAEAPIRWYDGDAYDISRGYFYRGLTNANALSEPEAVFGLTAALHQAQFGALVTGTWPQRRAELDAVLPDLCFLEAHDVMIVQETRRGEFHARNNNLLPPYSRETLGDEARATAEKVTAALAPTGPAGDWLYNAAGANLAFARVRHPEMYTGEGLIPCGLNHYAVGPIPAWSAAPPRPLPTDWLDIDLPFVLGEWTIDVDGDNIIVNRADRCVALRLVDLDVGTFIVTETSAALCGEFGHVRVVCVQDHPLELAIVDLVTTADAAELEVNVRYNPRSGFNQDDRWSDYLAVEVAVEDRLESVRRCSPNITYATTEDRIVSPWYLGLETTGGRELALLNEGAYLYEVDREAGTARWLLHVADEWVTERRMVLAFDRLEALQLARAWAQGLLPVDAIADPIPMPDEGWDGISLETLVDDNAVLLSNLADTERVLTFAVPVDVVDCDGEPLAEDNVATLGPFELAILRW